MTPAERILAEQRSDDFLDALRVARRLRLGREAPRNAKEATDG